MISISGPSLQEVDRGSKLYKKLADLHLRLAEKDSTIWGARAQKEASIRLNWIDAPTSSMQLIPDLQRLKERFSGLNNLILCGMGGSSLAPEVFAKSFAKQLFIVDSTDPNYIAHTDAFDLAKTLVIVSSKSGTTIELIALRNYFMDRFLRRV
jgi:glucose-6-phosphate isomerase